MALAELKQLVRGLGGRSVADKILIVGWFLHVHRKKVAFTGADIRQCYTKLDCGEPSSFGGYFQNIEHRKDMLKVSGGWSSPTRPRRPDAKRQVGGELNLSKGLAEFADTFPARPSPFITRRR